MSSVDIASVSGVLSLLGEHRDIAYLTLFLGAFLETLLPCSLIVYGEVFFLAGALLAGAGALDWWAVAMVLYSGGIAGDNASYWIGRRYGLTIFATMGRWPWVGRLIHQANYRKGVCFFQRRGAAAVFLARLSGPLSWVTPALAGAFKLGYPTFLLGNTLGVLVGIGEFLVLGYLLGSNLEAITHWLQRVGIVPLVVVALLLTLAIRRYRSAGH